MLAFAHRGGPAAPGNQGRENTLPAFAHAYGLGYRYLETDVHLTVDGHLVAFHDLALDRLTDGRGALATHTLAQVRHLKVGEEAVPTFEDLLDAFPDARFNVDLKGHGTDRALAELIETRALHDRVLVASFDVRRIRRFRRLTHHRVATAASPVEVALAATTEPARLARALLGPSVAAVQVPLRRGPLPVVTRVFCHRMHARGVQVHVWTLDTTAEIDAALAAGVDGVFTDRTDILKDVLVRAERWAGP